MKILYGVQGTGNGHITRAMEIIPYLQQKGEVDLLVSGIQSDIELPFEVKYRFNGLSFIFGKKGGVNYWKTFMKMNSMKLLKEIKKINVNDYDLVITSSVLIPEGHTVTMVGKVVLNKDFGSGYKYAILLEEGQILK